MAKTILVVDDELSICESLSKILRAEDYEVLLAGNGQEAIEKYAARRIDVLILDLNMPIKSGWAKLEWLSEVNPLLPVVIITGRSNQSALARTAGADVLMEKPLKIPLLLRTIREWMEEPIEQRAERARKRESEFRVITAKDRRLKEMQFKRLQAESSIHGQDP